MQVFNIQLVLSIVIAIAAHFYVGQQTTQLPFIDFPAWATHR